jgi:DNA-binding beta-propeller fold protein YncE
MRTLLLVCAAGATLLAQAPAPKAPGPTPLWTVTTGFASPESAYYHPQSGSVFVSNINGGVLEKDGNGYLTRIAMGGKVIGEKWATGLNAPKGIRSVGMTIWVADIDEVVGFELTAAGARLDSRVKVDGAQFLNDLATSPDGTIYVSDSNQSRIYMVRDGKSSVFVEGADVGDQPNGLLVDGDRLILGTIGRAPAGGRLLAFDVKTKQRTQLTSENVGGIDGIEVAEQGAYFLTDVIGRRLLHVGSDGKVITLATFDQAGADFGIQPLVEQLARAGTVFVPFLFSNSVSAYDLYPLIRAAR